MIYMQPIASPCIRVCVLIEDTCVGCRRTIHEIIDWKAMSDAEKATVMERVSIKCEADKDQTLE